MGTAARGFQADSEALLLVGIVTVAAILRFYHLGAQSLWGDEATTWVQSTGGFRDILAATAADNYPPLHNLLVAGMIRLFGDAEWVMRFPSAILGVLTVPIVAAIATMLAGRRAGLIAATLIALSAFHVWYSQEARAYALMAFAASAFAASSLWLLRSVTRFRLTVVLLSGAALLYSHPYGTFCWLAIGGAILLTTLTRPTEEGPSAAMWMLAQLAVAIAFAPWAWILLHRAQRIETIGFWIDEPTMEFVGVQILALGSGIVSILILFPAAVLAFVGGGTETLALTVTPTKAIVAAWLLVPLVLGLIASWIGTPILTDRYLIGSLPALFILAAVGLSRFVVGPRSMAAVAALVLAVSLAGLVYGGPPPRDDWRGASSYVYAQLPPGTCFVVPYFGVAQAIFYYGRRPFQCVFDIDRGLPANLRRILIAYRGNESNIARRLSSPPWLFGTATSFGGVGVVSATRGE
jgi:uncharacterized membrane protein